MHCGTHLLPSGLLSENSEEKREEEKRLKKKKNSTNLSKLFPLPISRHTSIYGSIFYEFGGRRNTPNCESAVLLQNKSKLRKSIAFEEDQVCCCWVVFRCDRRYIHESLSLQPGSGPTSVRLNMSHLQRSATGK